MKYLIIVLAALPIKMSAQNVGIGTRVALCGRDIFGKPDNPIGTMLLPGFIPLGWDMMQRQILEKLVGINYNTWK